MAVDPSAFVTDDTAQQAAPPDPPDFARIIPISAIQDAKQQQVADQWMQQQQADLADQWYSLHKSDLDSMVQDWQNGWQTGGGAASLGEPQAPETAAPPAEASSDQASASAGMMPSAEQPPQPQQNDVIQQFLGGLGDLVDRIKGVAANAVGPHPELQAIPGVGTEQPTTSIDLSKIMPNLESVTAPIGENLNQLTGGKFGEATGKVGNLSLGDIAQQLAPLTAEDVAPQGNAADMATQPTVGSLATTAASMIAPGPGHAPLGTEATEAGLTADAAQKLQTAGVPAIAGAAEDAIPVARETLTADHPLVQAAAQATGLDAGAISRLIQSPGFNPVNIVKAGSRKSPIQSAALAVYRATSDSEMANALIKAAQDATGNAEPTAEEIWNSVPGIGMHAAAPEDVAQNALEAASSRGDLANQFIRTPSSSEPSIQNLANAGTEPTTSGMGGKAPPAAPSGGFGDLWRTVNRGIVQAKMMNPLIHTWNLLSETLSQYADPRALSGIIGDFKTAEAATRDPSIAAKLVDESNGRLNLASQRPYTDDVGAAVGGGVKNVPVVGGAKNAYDAVTAFNHRMLFENLAQRLQIASYEGAKRMGMDPEAAAAYANAKFGQISNADRSTLMQWVGNNAAFAGRWLQGTGIQLGSLIGKPGFGGYAATLSDAQKTQLAAGLRGDFLKGNALLIGSHAIINHQLSGKWPWENEPGRWLDINTGQTDDQGRTIYVPDPFFRREQDALHLLAVPIPGNPAMQAMGTTTTSALANKAAPLIGAAADIASGSQYLSPSDQPPGVTGGPPIIAPGTADAGDMAKQMGAFAFNELSPVQVKYGAGTRSPEGIKLTNPTLNFDVGPNSSKAGIAAGVAGAITGANAAVGPRDIGTKDEYFQRQEDQAYSPEVTKPFRDAGVQLSTMPNQFSAGTGSNKVSVPTTAADKPVFQQAYGKVLQQGLQQYAGKTNKAVLTAIEQKAFSAGKAAVEKTLTKDEVQRRIGVASGSSTSAATAFWKSGAGGPSVPSSTPSRPASSGGQATAFWKKAS